MNRLLVLLAWFAVISGVKLPPNFKKCNRNEPKWKECVLEAGRDGIPQLNRRYAFILGGSVLEGVISENVTVELLMKYEEVKKKGKYILGEQINTVINENRKVFYEDMEETFEEVVMQIVINMVNKFFAKVLIEEAFD
ncbi:hypothetical protein MTP99_006236 [Tenebrio molitor]|nr:hypothetical protein MTP99_006236 [Tenebrio molitor]